MSVKHFIKCHALLSGNDNILLFENSVERVGRMKQNEFHNNIESLKMGRLLKHGLTGVIIKIFTHIYYAFHNIMFV